MTFLVAIVMSCSYLKISIIKLELLIKIERTIANVARSGCYLSFFRGVLLISILF